MLVGFATLCGSPSKPFDSTDNRTLTTDNQPIISSEHCLNRLATLVRLVDRPSETKVNILIRLHCSYFIHKPLSLSPKGILSIGLTGMYIYDCWYLWLGDFNVIRMIWIIRIHRIAIPVDRSSLPKCGAQSLSDCFLTDFRHDFECLKFWQPIEGASQ